MKILLSIIIFPLLIFAQNNINNNQLDEWNNFNKKYGDRWKIKWNHSSGAPASIFGSKSRTYGNISYNSAKEFLNELKGVFGNTDNFGNLIQNKQKEFNSTGTISFKQQYDGIPIYNSDISITFNKDNQIVFLCANYFNNLTIGNNESISSEQAIEIALTITGVTETEIQTAEKMIYPTEDNALFVWKVFLRGYDSETYQIIIDAESEKIMDIQDLIPAASTAKINYYPIDPINSSILTNQNAYRLDDTGYLRGDYVNVLTDLSSRAYQKYEDFTFQPNDVHFNEANVYWHVDNIAHNYFYSNLEHTMDPINAIIRNGSGGSYDPYNDHLNLGGVADTSDPDAYPHYRCLSRKDDQIYHEYTHAVVMRIGLNYNTDEVSARNEGYADYFACSFTNDPEYGEWFAYDAPHMRIVNNSSSTFNYKNWGNISYNDNYNGSNHLNGMIWSGACWDLRTALGQTVADKIIFQGVFNSNGSYDFETAMNGIIAADYEEYSGSHVNTIESIFNNRSILNPSAPTGLSVSGSYGQHPTISWTRSKEPDVWGYEVYRSFDGGAYGLVYTINKSYVTNYTDPNSTIGSSGDPLVCYKVKAKDKYGNKSVLSNSVCVHDGGINKEITNNAIEEIKEYSLSEGFPNPFNPSTNIRITVPEKSIIKLEVFNALGKKMTTLENGTVETGKYEYKFNANNLPSGIYYVHLTCNGLINDNSFSKTNKVILLK